ncbi:MAG: hypothetical protein QW818_01220 [Candidatus Aenigmatarchaeota archaeon]|nr:hypothetical protein [Candidatus Aenigmarchaeota archaeon]
MVSNGYNPENEINQIPLVKSEGELLRVPRGSRVRVECFIPYFEIEGEVILGVPYEDRYNRVLGKPSGIDWRMPHDTLTHPPCCYLPVRMLDDAYIQISGYSPTENFYKLLVNAARNKKRVRITGRFDGSGLSDVETIEIDGQTIKWEAEKYEIQFY